MDMGLGGADWTQVDENSVGEFAPVPDNWYMVSGTKSEMKPTKKGPKALNVEWTIQQGEFKKRLVFDDFNIHNPNPTARNIALAAVKKAFIANGKQPCNDSSQLLHGTLWIKVVVTPPRPKNDGSGGMYPAGNEVKDYLSLQAYQEKLQKEGGGQQQHQQHQGGNGGNGGGHQQHQQHQQNQQQQHGGNGGYGDPNGGNGGGHQQQHQHHGGNTGGGYGDPNAGGGNGGGYGDPNNGGNGGYQGGGYDNTGPGNTDNGMGGGNSGGAPGGGAGGGMPWE